MMVFGLAGRASCGVGSFATRWTCRAPGPDETGRRRASENEGDNEHRTGQRRATAPEIRFVAFLGPARGETRPVRGATRHHASLTHTGSPAPAPQALRS
jgi:hypothetical protein